VSRQRSEAEYAYFILLVRNGGECEHPVAFRHRRQLPGAPAFADWHADDPMEWECGVCGTVQMRAAQP